LAFEAVLLTPGLADLLATALADDPLFFLELAER
jgi:hypothetical protein